MQRSQRKKRLDESSRIIPDQASSMRRIPRMLMTQKTSYLKKAQVKRISWINKCCMNGQLCRREVSKAFTLMAINKWQKVEKLSINMKHHNNNSFQNVVTEIGKSLYKLEDLNLDLEGCPEITDQELKIISLQKLYFLRILHINLEGCIHITDEGLRTLGREIGRNMTWLQELDLNVSRCELITIHGAKMLVAGLGRHLNRLQAFHFSFHECQNITAEDLEMLGAEMAKNLPVLQELFLDFFGCNKISDNAVEVLSSKLETHFDKLKYLSLDFSVSNITDKGIQTLAKILWNKTMLKKLEFFFIDCPKISDKSIKTLASSIGVRLPHLQTLVLMLTGSRKITASGIEALAVETIQKLLDLQDFWLYLDELPSGLTDKAVKILVSSVTTHLRKLRNLTLKLHSCKATNGTFKALGWGIRDNLTQLQELNIQFTRSQRITDEGLKLLAEGIGKNLDQLRKFTLWLQNCSKISDKGIKVLMGKMGKHLSKLRSLELDFSFCEQLTDQEMRTITSEAIQHFGHLDKLRFAFPMSAITNKEIVNLALTMKEKLIYLQSLELDLRSCKAVTYMGIKSLGSRLGEMRSLRYVTLYYDEPKKKLEGHFRKALNFIASWNVELITQESL